MKLNNPLISCIIPVYNGVEFIRKCLNVLLDQPYKNLEIIIINDGSTDGTGDLIAKFAMKDDRMRIITFNENQGISIARNAGMQHANGEYIQFIDSDDTVSPNIYDELLSYLNNQHDIIIFDYYKFYTLSNYYQLKTRKIKHNIIATSGADKLTMLKHGGVVVWNKVYKRDFLINHNIFFVEFVLYEDIPFFWDVILHAQSIVYINIPLYIYIQRHDSIMNSKLSVLKAKDIVKVMVHITTSLEVLAIDSSSNIYLLFINKMLKTYDQFFRKTYQHQDMLFNDMSQSVSNIDLQSLKSRMSKKYYLKLWLLKNKKYKLYYLINLLHL